MPRQVAVAGTGISPREIREAVSKKHGQLNAMPPVQQQFHNQVIRLKLLRAADRVWICQRMKCANGWGTIFIRWHFSSVGAKGKPTRVGNSSRA
jgi:hypothetical protein